MKKLFLGVVLGVCLAITLYIGYKWNEEDQKKKEIETNILSSETKPEQIHIDLQKQTGTISPLLFGGTHSPLINHEDAWDQVTDAGVTIMRRDFFMEQIVPANITLQDYITNKKDVQNPKTWNKLLIRAAGDRYKLAKEHGMKTMGVVDYAPAWLTYSGTNVGVPKDWTIFRDIVKKHYLMFRDNLDYIEVWNEPTFDRFNDIKNSDLSMEQAYVHIAKNTIEVIRQVDHEKGDGKRIKIGGLVADNPDRTTMLRAILDDEYIKSQLNFISYHTYDHPEPTYVKYRKILDEYGMHDMPLFVTEWNYDAKETELNPYKSETPAIVYTADKLLTMMKNGIQGANYYMLEPIDYDTPGIGKKYMGFYRYDNGTAELLPQARTWRLLSKSLELGNDDSIMVDTTSTDSLKTVGFINKNKKEGIAIVNNTNTPHVVSLNFNSPNHSSVKNLKVYYASADNDGAAPIIDFDIPATKNGYSYSVFIPEQSLVGVILSDNVSILNQIRYSIIPQ